MSDLKPNLKYDHVFAIVRVDDNKGQMVTVKKVMWDADKAEQEVERLNELKAHSKYYVQVTRIERK